MQRVLAKEILHKLTFFTINSSVSLYLIFFIGSAPQTLIIFPITLAVLYMDIYCPSSVIKIWYFPVWLQNRLLSAGLEPVLSHTNKPYVAL